MTREEAIEMIASMGKYMSSGNPIWKTEPVKKATDMAIEALKENNQSDSLVRDDAENCKESESKLDLISRQAVLDFPIRLDHYDEEHGNRVFVLGIESVMEYVESLPSAEPPYQYSEAYVNQLRGERDILQDMVNNMAEPKTGEWVKVVDEETQNVTKWHYECDQCGAGRWEKWQRYCQNCGARMTPYKGGEDE